MSTPTTAAAPVRGARPQRHSTTSPVRRSARPRSGRGRSAFATCRRRSRYQPPTSGLVRLALRGVAGRQHRRDARLAEHRRSGPTHRSAGQAFSGRAVACSSTDVAGDDGPRSSTGSPKPADVLDPAECAAPSQAKCSYRHRRARSAGDRCGDRHTPNAAADERAHPFDRVKARVDGIRTVVEEAGPAARARVRSREPDPRAAVARGRRGARRARSSTAPACRAPRRTARVAGCVDERAPLDRGSAPDAVRSRQRRNRDRQYSRNAGGHAARAPRSPPRRPSRPRTTGCARRRSAITGRLWTMSPIELVLMMRTRVIGFRPDPLFGRRTSAGHGSTSWPLFFGMTQFGPLAVSVRRSGCRILRMGGEQPREPHGPRLSRPSCRYVRRHRIARVAPHAPSDLDSASPERCIR